MKYRYRYPAILCALGALALAGCGEHPVGSVSGTVTVQGKPLTYGLITFESTDPEVQPRVVTATITNGKYSIEKVPAGEVRIAVSSIRPNRSAGANPEGTVDTATSAPPPKGPYIPVPPKFGNTAESGLTYEVKSTSQTHDIDIPAP